MYEDRQSLIPHPRPIPNFTITRDTLTHMSPIHRLVAEELVRTGKWRIIEGRCSSTTESADHTPQAVTP